MRSVFSHTSLEVPKVGKKGWLSSPVIPKSFPIHSSQALWILQQETKLDIIDHLAIQGV